MLSLLPRFLIIVSLQLIAFVGASAANLATNAEIRTTCLRATVNAASEIGVDQFGSMFSYFGDDPSVPGYLRDAYLILGTSANDLSYAVQGGPYSGVPTPSNPFGYMIEGTPLVVDSVTNLSFCRATGTGFNRDSSLQFTVDWYTSKRPDSCNFVIGMFRIYKGPKPGTVTGLTVAYFADWDVPSDSGVLNYCGAEAAVGMLWLQGSLAGSADSNHTRFGALAGRFRRYASCSETGAGGFVAENDVYIDPQGTWENDSLWNRLQILQGQYSVPLSHVIGSGTPADLSIVFVGAKNQSVDQDDTLLFLVELATVNKNNGGFAKLRNAVWQARNFAGQHGIMYFVECAKCGDADNNGLFTISDAVYLIAYIFAGGPAPAIPSLGDADGNTLITISDAVYLINYIFAGGPAPHCA